MSTNQPVYFPGELSLNYGLRVHVFDTDKSKMKDVNYQIAQQKEELIRNGLLLSVDSYVSDLFERFWPQISYIIQYTR